ncbi:MAG: RagB/SusD family nutrient uptake outer membrane protein [Prevotellaceae bacterium]|jgi:hypothetical protein|nr:RagB/SusD family nutrient uptake outer membrane protein [Prevotellaceae bacterium]
MKLKLIEKICLTVVVIIGFTSCNKYLDLVPDNLLQVEDLFTTRADADNALAKIYSFLPAIDNIHETPFMLGDEYVCNKRFGGDDGSKLLGQKIMQSVQSTSNPILGLWSGTGGGKHYYVALRHCDLVLQHIHLVHDMSETEKEEMSAQVTFLKAYYAFLLIKQYGPIVIPQYLETDETDPAKLFPKRSNIDESFDYVLNLMNEAIPKLRRKVVSADYGQVDQTVAKSIKARVLLFRASPLFNGNNDLHGQFRNIDGTLLFPPDYKKEKWKDAIDAIDDAIKTCLDAGVKMYKFGQNFPMYDSTFLQTLPERSQTFYDLRYILCDPWNTELIWGKSDMHAYGASYDVEVVANACNIRLPDDPDYKGAGYSEANLPGGAWQSVGASYQMLERYYTENGLPINEDKTFIANEKYRHTIIPSREDPAYGKYLGLMQPEAKVIKLYLNRELRFYANLVINGGYSRSHRYLIRTDMLYDTPGGRYASNNPDDYFPTGIGIQKMVHPESGAGLFFAQVRYPMCFIRLADLYLMKAEALNEYKDAPDQEVWDAINVVRRRAGIPDVEVAWSDDRYAITLNKHKNKSDMRNIILQERSIEFAFEGSHYWDMVRHKRATAEFSQPVMGWNVYGKTPEDFFVLGQVQSRRFALANYFWPIPLGELNINRNLVQSQGW